ncbi:MAG: SpoIIE family protein phosphatase [Tepidisphaeraceae bacterium]
MTPLPQPLMVDIPAESLARIDQLQAEITDLKDEVNLLRRRDETLKFYMHRLDEELRLAARLQQDFLPKMLPQIGPIHFHTIFRPAGYVSGDLYDVMRLDEAHVAFYMVDAVGHGLPAALLTMFIKNTLVTKQLIPGGYRLLNPGEALAAVNRSLIEQNLTQATFATAVYGIINSKTLECRFARAGHPLPMLLKPNGLLTDLKSEGSLLGIFPDEVFGDYHLQLEPGDRLFVYSDGIEVAFADDQTPADTHQWRIELQNRANLPTEQILSEISGLLDREIGSLTPRDDLSLIAIDVTR